MLIIDSKITNRCEFDSEWCVFVSYDRVVKKKNLGTYLPLSRISSSHMQSPVVPPPLLWSVL